VCRFVGYLGPPVALSALVLDPPHSLLRQSWAPRRQTHGVVNADGFGVGWYDLGVRAEPALYRSARPMWSDRNLPSLAPLVSSGAVVAAVRSATPPLPVEETSSPPFAVERWLFAHNGAVDGLGGVLRPLVSSARLAGVLGPSDAELLFAMALDRLDGGASVGEAVASVVSSVLAVTTGRLNLLLSDGVSMAATACGDSLFTCLWGGGVVVASEPFDDSPEWRAVDDGSLVVATAESCEVVSL
jgi:glutamine amidotransferase